MFDLSGKKALVTGATRGLGRSMAEALMEAGAEVVLMGSSASARTVAEEYRERGSACHGVACDLSSAGAREAGFHDALLALDGSLDILVNAAGVQSRHPAESFPAQDWANVIEVNLTAVFSLCQLAGRVMLKKGSGKIINVASLLSYFGGITVPAYAASKGGVMQLTKALSNEWASRGVNVNAIAPGYMKTDLNAALLADPVRLKELSARIPAQRWGEPADLKGPTVFLASDASDYVHGTMLAVDGGYLGR